MSGQNSEVALYERAEVAPSPIRSGAPMTFAEQMRMAEVLAKSGLLPSTLDTAEKAFVAVQWGAELGLSPMVAASNIAVVNGRPTLSADIMNAIVSRSPEYAGCVWEETSEKRAKCTVTRKRAGGLVEKYDGEFTIQEAAAAGLANKDNWKHYPKRMLKHRALSFALRDAFPDTLAGMYTPEEMLETIPERNITDEAAAETARAEVTEKSELTAEQAQELKEMFGSGLFTDQEHDDALSLYKSGQITAEKLVSDVRELYIKRNNALNDAFEADKKEAEQ